MIGFINIYKPSNMTSNAVVQKIKKHFNIKKIGHMGTLDPMACGILPLAIGKATRLFDYMLQKVKRYIVEYQFGYETDTLDSTGTVINSVDKIPTVEEITKVIASMIGKMNQIPPKYSAKNINGARAYDLARKGIDFDLKPKEIEIFEIKLLDYQENNFRFSILCSSGTYIRAIGRDIAQKVNSLATMTYLERSESANFTINNSIKLEEVLKLENVEDIVISPINVFNNFDIIKVNEKEYIDLKNGKKIEGYKINKNTFILFNDRIIAVCKGNKDYLKIDTFLEE